MKTLTKSTIVVTLLGIVGLAGVVSVVRAVQPQAIAPDYRISDRETNDDAEEQQESAKLRPLAKISPQQAQQAAEADRGGRARSVKLENDDGNLVYAVVIGQQEVKVDAGNGRVLYTEALNGDDDKNEASRPRSSIQVPEPPGGDGETNDDG